MRKVLPNLWYVLMPSDRLKSGANLPQTIFDQSTFISRSHDDQLHIALRGEVTNKAVPEIVCCEQQGLIWAYSGSNPATCPRALPCAHDARPQIAASVELPCDFDNAVYGLLDPAHVPFVHRSKWWRPRHRLREKTKVYVPHPYGFTMARHASTQGELSYRLLGGDVSTEIVFELPALRTECISGSRGAVCSVTSVTPLSVSKTRMTHCLYWTMKGFAPFKPLIRYLTLSFLKEDWRVLSRQQEGLRHSPPQLLVGDADELMKWYMRISNAWHASQSNGSDFVNPIKGRTLRWRS